MPGYFWYNIALAAEREYYRYVGLLTEATIVRYKGTKKFRALNDIEAAFELAISAWLIALHKHIVNIALNPDIDYVAMDKAMSQAIDGAAPTLSRIITSGTERAFIAGWADGLDSVPKSEAAPGKSPGSPPGLPNSRVASWLGTNSSTRVTNISNDLRQTLQQTLEKGRTQGLSYQQLAKEIQNLSTADFGPKRAKVIAVTELARAYEEGNKEGPRQLQALGIQMVKEWIGVTDGKLCPVCAANIDEPPIGIDHTFQSGHDTPPAHPNCRCTAIYARAKDKVGAGVAGDIAGLGVQTPTLPDVTSPLVLNTGPPGWTKVPFVPPDPNNPQEVYDRLNALMKGRLMFTGDGTVAPFETTINTLDVGPEVAPDLLRAMERMKALYPGAWDSIKMFEFVSFGMKGYPTDQWAHFARGQGTLRFNTDYWNADNEAEFLRTIFRSEETGWHSTDGSVDAVFIHEFGHVFDNWARLTHHQEYYDPTPVPGVAGGAPVPYPGDAVSDYGQTSLLENFAEAWAQMHTKNPNFWTGDTDRVAAWLDAIREGPFDPYIVPGRDSLTTGVPVIPRATDTQIVGHTPEGTPIFSPSGPDPRDLFKDAVEVQDAVQAYNYYKNTRPRYTHNEENFLSGYVLGPYNAINRRAAGQSWDEINALQGIPGGTGPQSGVDETVDALTRICNKAVLTADTVLWRGADSGVDYQPGMTIKRDAFTSTSLLKETAVDFAFGGGVDDSVVFKILAPKGTHVAYPGAFEDMSSPPPPDEPTEAEILLQRGQRWRVVSVERISTKYGPMRQVTVQSLPEKPLGTKVKK